MKSTEFNDSGALPSFTFERDNLHERSWHIYKWLDCGIKKEPVGEYTVLDLEECEDLSEKKVMNLISILNQKNTLMELGEGTDTRLLYHIVTEGSDDGRATVIFYQLEKQGVSRENAILRIDPDCIDLKEASERQCSGASDSSFVRPEIEHSSEATKTAAPNPNV